MYLLWYGIISMTLFFYTIKQYNTPSTILYSFTLSTWTLNPSSLVLDIKESEAILVLGNEVTEPTETKYLFVVASGSDRILRYNIDANNTIEARAQAVLTPDINQISSAIYFYPFIYYITYEPDAKLVRIPKTSFCSTWCGTNGYCNLGYCVCQNGYTADTDLVCKPTDYVNVERQEKQSEGAAAALGVCFAFALVAAIAGWYLWWRGRKSGVESRPLSS